MRRRLAVCALSLVWLATSLPACIFGQTFIERPIVLDIPPEVDPSDLRTDPDLTGSCAQDSHPCLLTIQRDIREGIRFGAVRVVDDFEDDQIEYEFFILLPDAERVVDRSSLRIQSAPGEFPTVFEPVWSSTIEPCAIELQPFDHVTIWLRLRDEIPESQRELRDGRREWVVNYTWDLEFTGDCPTELGDF